MPGYWQAKPVQYCHLFKKLEDVTSCFESTYKTLSVIWFGFVCWCFFVCIFFFLWYLLLGMKSLNLQNRILGLQASRLINWTALSSWKSVTPHLTLASLLWVAKGLLFDLCLWPFQSQHLDTCGVAAGGCKIQVLVSGMYFYSCAIWIFRHFLLLCLSCLHLWLCWTAEQPVGCLLGQTVYASPLSSLMPFVLNHS